MSEKNFSHSGIRGGGIPAAELPPPYVPMKVPTSEPDGGGLMTPRQRACIHILHRDMGVYCAEWLYEMYLAQTTNLVAAQAEIKALRQFVGSELKNSALTTHNSEPESDLHD